MMEFSLNFSTLNYWNSNFYKIVNFSFGNLFSQYKLIY
ncbi:hypothetical protein AB988_2498 [Acinetobacter baumannii]|nr:hypothetical protein AB994_0458 [Acinetobacter baumannii]KMV13084.1 hypothetical protein AB988_2498 [Acinetobacter baumannii]